MKAWRRGPMALMVAMLLSGAACSGEPPVASGPADPSKTADVAAQAEIGALADLIDTVPADAAMFTLLPPVGPFKIGPLAEARGFLGEAIAKELSVDADLTLRLLDAFDGAAVFAGADIASGRREPSLSAAIRFRDPKAVESLLAALGSERITDGTIAVKTRKGSLLFAYWAPRARVLFVSPNRDTLGVSLATARKSSPSMRGAALFAGAEKHPAYFAADLAALVPDPRLAEAASRITAGITEAGDIALDLKLLGAQYPRLGEMLEPIDHTLLGRLPAGSTSAMSLSLKRRAGVTIFDLVKEVARAFGEDRKLAMGEGLIRARLGFAFDELEAALGDELAAATYATDSNGSQLEFVALCAIKDSATAKKVLALVRELLQKEKRKVTGAGPRWSLTLSDGRELQVELKGDLLRLAVAEKTKLAALVKRLDDSKGLLSSSDNFRKRRQAAVPRAHLMSWLDLSSAAALTGVPAETLGSLPSGGATIASIVLRPEAHGLSGTLSASEAVPLIGTSAAIGVAAVRKYLAASKQAEARMTLGAIARGALAAFEREQADGAMHRLCSSSSEVPRAIPAGESSDPGDGFESGDEAGGWRCLKFSLSQKLRYRYAYRQGSGYKGPAHGGPDPGPQGFEVSAEGDLDGDGKTSLFTLTGKLDPRTQRVEISPEIFAFQADE